MCSRDNFIQCFRVTCRHCCCTSCSNDTLNYFFFCQLNVDKFWIHYLAYINISYLRHSNAGISRWVHSRYDQKNFLWYLHFHTHKVGIFKYNKLCFFIEAKTWLCMPYLSLCICTFNHKSITAIPLEIGHSPVWDEGYHFAKFKRRCSMYEAYLLKSYL